MKKLLIILILIGFGVNAQNPVTISSTFRSDGTSTVSRNDYTFKIYNNGVLYHTVGSHNSDPTVTVSGNAVTITDVPIDAYNTSYSFVVNPYYNFNEKFGGLAGSYNSGAPPVVVVTNSLKFSNSTVKNSQPSRIYFNTSQPLNIGTLNVNTAHFRVSDNTITGVVATGSGIDNYFTVSTPYTFWDNSTINYSGGSTIEDSEGNELQPFTLTYIDNEISQPTLSGTEYYVTTSGSNGNNGTSEGTAWATATYAATQVSAGDKVWIKAGNYGAENIVAPAAYGAIDNPIVFEGYKNTIGDITTNYYVPYDNESDVTAANLDAAEMPLFDGGDTDTGTGFELREPTPSTNSAYLIIKNLQFANYQYGVETRTDAKDVIFNRINVKESGSATQLNGYCFQLSNFDYSNERFRLLNSNAINGSESQVEFRNQHGLIENTNSYSDRDDGDYMFGISGSDNIVKNSLARNKSNLGFSGHGFSVKYISEYNLFDSNLAINVENSFVARHNTANYNVFKEGEAHGNVPVQANNVYGLTLYGGSIGTVFERNNLHDLSRGIFIVNNGEGVSSMPQETIIRNNTFDGISDMFARITNNLAGAVSFTNNKIYHNTINDVAEEMFQLGFTDNGTITMSGNEVKNNIFNDLRDVDYQVATGFRAPTTGEMSFEYNNTWDVAFGTNGVAESGTGNISVDPLLVSGVATNELLNVGAVTTTKTDYSGETRSSTPTIGAHEILLNQGVFPGAKGYGADWVFTSDYEVRIVTNLNDSGTGSLRNAITDATANAGVIIVFNGLSGIIEQNSLINIPNTHQIYIAGQTSENGIVLHGGDWNGAQLRMDGTENGIIVRGLFFDRDNTPFANTPGNGDCIAIGAYSNTNMPSNIIFDRCTFTSARDDLIQFWESSTNITIQNSILAEPVGNGSTTAHLASIMGADGSYIGANNITWFNNAFITNKSRTPSIHKSGLNLEFVNNIIYNSLSDATKIYDSGTPGGKDFNFINNHWIDGPETSTSFHNRVVITAGTDANIYAKGNLNYFRQSQSDPEWDAFRLTSSTTGQASTGQQSLTAHDTPLKDYPVSTTQELIDAQYNNIGTFARNNKEVDFLDDIPTNGQFYNGSGTGTYYYDTTGAETPKYTYTAASISAGTSILDTNSNGIPDAIEENFNNDTFDYINSIAVSVTPPSGPTADPNDVFPQDNAASTSDVNAVSSWTTVSATAASIGTGAHDGTYHMRFTNTSNFGRALMPLTLENGETYDISIWVKKDAGNATPAYIQGITGFASGPSYDEITQTTWTEFTYTLVANATVGEIRFDFSSGAGTHLLDIDLVTVIKQ